MTPRLKSLYEKNIIPKLMQKFDHKNKHQVAKIQKVILNMGLGEDASDTKKLKTCLDDMGLITGQRPVVTNFCISLLVLKDYEVIILNKNVVILVYFFNIKIKFFQKFFIFTLKIFIFTSFIN